MPNWCQNKLVIRNREELDFPVEGMFSYFLPEPYTEEEGDAEHPTENMPLWWVWRNKEWGTKWDLFEDNVAVSKADNGITLRFNTAWGPPLGIYKAMWSRGYDIRAHYFEPGMGFAGVWEGGVDHAVSVSYEDNDLDEPTVTFSDPTFVAEMYGDEEVDLSF